MKSNYSFSLALCVLLALLGLAGCYQPVSRPQIVSAPSRPPTELAVRRSVVGRSVEGRPIECIVLGNGYDVTFILATIHGNEPAGTPLAERLAQYLQDHPDLLWGRKVAILPVANPDGMAHGSRSNANGVDLNRNFATANRQDNAQNGFRALSEPEARVIHQLIRQHSPDRIVSIHQPLTCIDYDGPADRLASRMARACDLPMRKLGAQPGSLGSYAGLTLRIPTITLELPAKAEQLSPESLWDRYGMALLTAVVYPDRAE